MKEIEDYIVVSDNYKCYLSEKIIDKSFENLAELDDDFMMTYLAENTVDANDILTKSIEYIRRLQLTPVIFGSAKLKMGIELLLNRIVDLHSFECNDDLPSSARVFKVEYDAKHGRLAYLRLFSGNIKNKESIWSQYLEKEITSLI